MNSPLRPRNSGPKLPLAFTVSFRPGRERKDIFWNLDEGEEAVVLWKFVRDFGGKGRRCSRICNHLMAAKKVGGGFEGAFEEVC